MARSASRVSTPAEGVLKQEISFPQPPTAEPRDSEDQLGFWEQLCAVPENQWATEFEKGHRVYLYDHDSPGSKYLAVIFHPFDIEWIKQTYGGGRYRAQLNDSSGRIVCKEIFAIEGESKRKPPQNAQSPTAPAHADSFQSQVLELIRDSQRRQEEFLNRFLERDRDRNSAPGPTAQVDPTTLFRSMVEMFKEMLPAHKPMDLMETIALVEKLRGPDLLTVLAKAKEAGIIPAAGGSGDLLGQLNAVIAVADKIGMSAGKGKGLGEALIEKGPEILEAGAKLIDRYKSVEDTRLQTARTVREIQQQGAAPIVTPPAPQHPSVTQHSGAHPGAAPQVIPPAPGASGLEVETPSPTAQAVLSQAEQQEVFVMTKVVEAIANGDTGQQIVDFLDMINPAICTSFEGATVGQIEGYFGSHPVLKKATALPRFRPALAEIVDVLNAPDEEIPDKAVN